MTDDEVRELSNGLYLLRWQDGGISVAAVGRDHAGHAWFAPANWITVPSFDWTMIASLETIVTVPSLDRVVNRFSDAPNSGPQPAGL